LKIVYMVKIYLLNTYNFFPIFFVTYNLKFFEMVAWEHEMGGIIGYFPVFILCIFMESGIKECDTHRKLVGTK
jgi:hypothetical protein